MPSETSQRGRRNTSQPKVDSEACIKNRQTLKNFAMNESEGMTAKTNVKLCDSSTKHIFQYHKV